MSLQHPVAIKLEDLPRSPASDSAANVGEFCYFHSNNSPTSAPVNYYHAADPEILPGPEIIDEPTIIEIVEEEFVEESGTNPVFETLTERPVDANQQQIRTLSALFPDPPLRHLNLLAQIHQHPFTMFQDPLQHPSSELMFADAMLDDPLIGSIHLRDLPLCVELSNTIAAFCLNFLAAPPEVDQIRDITSLHMQPTSRHITKKHRTPDSNYSRLSRDEKLYLLSMTHTLNRATNLLVQHFTDEQ